MASQRRGTTHANAEAISATLSNDSRSLYRIKRILSRYNGNGGPHKSNDKKRTSGCSCSLWLKFLQYLFVILKRFTMGEVQTKLLRYFQANITEVYLSVRGGGVNGFKDERKRETRNRGI